MLLVIGGVELNPGPIDGTRQSRLGSKGEVLDLEQELYTIKNEVNEMKHMINNLQSTVKDLVHENTWLKARGTVKKVKLAFLWYR